MSELPAHNNGIASIPTQITDLPLELLRAELQRRQHGGGSSADDGTPKPQCGTKGGQAEYSVSSHVFALILILILSTVACAFPIIARRFPRLPIPHHFLFLSRHFGTGVLLATAFVHLLPTAFLSLSDPCLPDFFIKRYPPMPGFVAMLAVLVVVGIEMFFASQGAGHVHGSDFDSMPAAGAGGAHAGHGEEEDTEMYNFGATTPKEPKFGRASGPRGYNGISLDDDDAGFGASEMDKMQASGLHDQERGTANGAAQQNGHVKLPDRDSDDEEDDDLALDLDELGPGANGDDDDDDADLLPSSSGNGGASDAVARRKAAHKRNQSHRSAVSGVSTNYANASPALAQRLLLQCVLLEAGILFHSVFIGMAVSVTRGSAFVVLLIAIAFHQTFEGFALGARIAAIVPLLPDGSPRPWLMALAYGTTTPIGQAIGLAIHGLYDPKSEAGLILVGCMNAISSGLLLFAGLVELLAEDFLSESSYKTLRGRRRTEACICVVAGCLLMAAVGAFA